jgi:translation elongation factor EF-Tu-like GTPase
MKRELIMVINDVLFISGRGVVILGIIQNEEIVVGQKIIIDPEYLPEFETEIKGIESFRKTLKKAFRSDLVGITLSGVEKNKVKKNMKVYQL